MKSQVTLLLICVLISKALSLTCQQCLSMISETCVKTTCSDECLTATTSVYMYGIKSDTMMKTCGTPDSCAGGSMNMGGVKVVNNVKCCKTDLCNTETLPAPPRQASNGRKCYTCDDKDCSRTISCEGTEDRCITASVRQGENIILMKGCATENFCGASGPRTTGIGTSNLYCCEGNLCNGAESVTLSFLLMLVPLLSSILFY